MEIRKANQTDSREEISTIYEQSWKYAYKGIIPQDYLDNIPSGQWRGVIDHPDRHTLIMLDGNKIIGTSGYGKSRSADYKNWGEIFSIYLLPEYMGKGYGKSLLKKAVEELKTMGFKTIFLWVLEENHGARHFYETCGFNYSGNVKKDTIGGKQLFELQYVYNLEERTQ